MSEQNLSIAHIYWLARQTFKQLGIVGILGAGLLVASVGFYLLQYRPLQAALGAAQTQLAAVKNAGEAAIATPPVLKVNPDSEWADFYQKFPEQASLPAALKVIQETALKHKLTFNRGDYKLTLTTTKKSAKQNIVRYEILLPVSGSYVQVRGFLDDVLVKLPTLALSELQLKRENVAVPAVDARLVLVYFLKADV